jgi:TRAP-type C4-dicarboxylate transport system permease small subunit
MQSLLRAITKINESTGKIGGYTAIAVTIFLTSYEIVSRTFFNAPTRFNLEAAILLQVVIVAVASGYILHEGGHISIGIVVENLHSTARNWLLFVCSIIALVYCVFLVVIISFSAVWNLRMGRYTENIGLPIGLMQLVLVGGLVLLCLQFVVKIHEYYEMAKGVSGKQE